MTKSLIAALAAVAALCTLAAPAGARERQTIISGAHGHGATRTVERAHGDVSSSTTTASGKTMSREVDRSATGTTATVTGPNGQTATRTATRTVTRTPAPSGTGQ